MRQTYFAVLMMSVTALLIVLTAVLFVTNRSFERGAALVVPIEVDTATTTTATTTAVQTPATSSTTVEELTSDKGELIQVRRLEGGVTHELRKEIAVRRWTHTSGVTATLYRTDEFYDAGGTTKHSITLRVKDKDGAEHTVFTFEPNPMNIAISHKEISAVDFSPLGTYIKVLALGYESHTVITADVKTGVEMFYPFKFASGYEDPYWNSDESKLIVITSAAPIDGTQATIHYSSTGLFDDLTLITEIGEEYQENFIENVKVSGNTLTATMTSNEWEEGVEGILTVDMTNGTYTATPEVVW